MASIMSKVDLPLSCWLVMLYHYEMWCYDIGWLAIDGLYGELTSFWESF